MANEPGGRSKRPSITDQEALLFHSRGRPGKLEIMPTGPGESFRLKIDTPEFASEGAKQEPAGR